MMAASLDAIKELRELTSCGVIECKKALESAAKKVEVLVKSSGKSEVRLFDEVRQRLKEADSGDYEVEEKEIP